jgi:hypothetical protein
MARHQRSSVLIALVVAAAILALFSIIFTSTALAAAAGLAFLALLVATIVFAVPSLRYKQTVKYDHSFLTNLFGGTSTPHPGQAAKKDNGSS